MKTTKPLVRSVVALATIAAMTAGWMLMEASNNRSAGSLKPAAAAPSPSMALPISQEIEPAATETPEDLFAAAADQALARLNSTNPLDQSRAFRELLPDLVRRDPQAAAAFAQSPRTAAWRNDLMVIVAQTWTEIDVDQAETWASELSNPTERNMALGYVSFAAAPRDPVRAAQVIENPQLTSDRREIIVANLAQQLAAEDLQPLCQQVGKLPAGEERDNLFRWLALAQSQKEPAQAATMIIDKIAAGPIQSDAAIQVLRQWARKDMPAAVAWANQFPVGRDRDQAMQVLSGELYGAYLPESAPQ